MELLTSETSATNKPGEMADGFEVLIKTMYAFVLRVKLVLTEPMQQQKVVFAGL